MGSAAKKTADATVEFNTKHDITGKTAAAARHSWAATKDFNTKHDITGRTVRGGRFNIYIFVSAGEEVKTKF